MHQNATQVKQISDEQIRAKITQIVNASEFIPKWIPGKAEELDRDKLEKLLIFVYQASEEEKKMNLKQKEELAKRVESYFKSRSEIYQTAEKEVRNELNKEQKEDDGKKADGIINQIINS